MEGFIKLTDTKVPEFPLTVYLRPWSINCIAGANNLATKVAGSNYSYDYIEESIEDIERKIEAARSASKTVKKPMTKKKVW